MTIAESNKVRVFYAEDDPDDAFFFKSIIAESDIDCELFIFSSGVDLIERISYEEDYHHVIFLDINMPYKNGFECLNEIKKNHSINSIPVYMISTSNADDYREKSLQLGAQDFIQKPSDFNALKAKIKAAIRSSMAS